MIKDAYPDDFPEQKAACKERAGWQCEVYTPNADGVMVRCTMAQYQIRENAQGHPYVVYLHAVHINRDIENEAPELVCMCAGHHMQFDRQAELKEWVSQRRRGYRLTTTDTLIAEAKTAGIVIEEHSDGYHWQATGTELRGKTTTAARAVSDALYQLRTALERTQREQSDAQQSRRLEV
jgi:hypothetical protein